MQERSALGLLSWRRTSPGESGEPLQEEGPLGTGCQPFYETEPGLGGELAHHGAGPVGGSLEEGERVGEPTPQFKRKAGSSPGRKKKETSGLRQQRCGLSGWAAGRGEESPAQSKVTRPALPAPPLPFRGLDPTASARTVPTRQQAGWARCRVPDGEALQEPWAPVSALRFMGCASSGRHSLAPEFLFLHVENGNADSIHWEWR